MQMIRSFALWVAFTGLMTGMSCCCVAGDRYRNETWSFCVDYPKGWQASHPIDEYAIVFRRDRSTSMSFGVIKDDESLEDNFRKAYLDDSSVSVTQKESTRFQGRPAIAATLVRNAGPSVAQRIVTVSAKDGVIYEFRISAPDSKTLNQLLPIFQSELDSFMFNCK
jgi:hypothetical protein